MIHSSDLLARFAVSNGNHIAYSQAVAGNVNHFAVDANVAVRHHLPGLENGLRIAEPPNRRRQSKFEEAKEVESGVAVHSRGFVERVSELPLHHMVVAPDDLLGQ